MSKHLSVCEWKGKVRRLPDAAQGTHTDPGDDFSLLKSLSATFVWAFVQVDNSTFFSEVMDVNELPNVWPDNTYIPMYNTLYRIGSL